MYALWHVVRVLASLGLGYLVLKEPVQELYKQYLTIGTGLELFPTDTWSAFVSITDSFCVLCADNSIVDLPAFAYKACVPQLHQPDRQCRVD